jgi:Holliday junction resolvase
MTPEKMFEVALVKELKKSGIFAHHFDAVGCDGWPDIIALKNNECLLLECKYHTLKLRDDQAALHIALSLSNNFNRIFTVSRMDHYYMLVDSCFRQYEHKFNNLVELVKAIDKEF